MTGFQITVYWQQKVIQSNKRTSMCICIVHTAFYRCTYVYILDDASINLQCCAIEILCQQISTIEMAVILDLKTYPTCAN